MTTFLPKSQMDRCNLKKNFILLSLYSASLLTSGCQGLADAKDSGELVLPIPHILEEKPPNYRPLPRRYDRIDGQKLAKSGITYPAISTTSNKSQIALAKYLTKKKVSFYGAWWCPHCHEQKELFGRAAFKFINYKECANADRAKPQTLICAKVKIKAYPTWIVKGKRLEGVQSLKTLATLSGYKGISNFTSP